MSKFLLLISVLFISYWDHLFCMLIIIILFQVKDFKQRALNYGISNDVIEDVMSNVRFT